MNEREGSEPVEEETSENLKRAGFHPQDDSEFFPWWGSCAAARLLPEMRKKRKTNAQKTNL